MNAFTHPLVAGPILSSHSLDLQDFPAQDIASAHVGPPTINVEARLLGVSDAAIEKGADPEGALVVRGPPVGKLLGEDYVDIPSGGNSPTSSEDDEGWVGIGARARVQPNGSFLIL